MKTIDYDSKIKSVKELLVETIPRAKMPPKKVVDKQLLAEAIKVISNELLKDPVLVSLMALRSNPTKENVDSFLTTVKDRIDHATARRYRELLELIFVEEKKNDQNV